MASKPVRVGIIGAGRMGLAIISEIGASDDHEVASVWVRDPNSLTDIATPSGAVISSDLQHVFEPASVAIDFSLPAATVAVCEGAVNSGTAIVCGVSGLNDEQFAALEQASKSIPIVYDRNMSQGVTVLEDLVGRAAASLGTDFSVTIRETHHAHKKDAPSGKALKLGESIASARGEGVEYESERRGEVPRDHEVVFESPTETLTLGHSVTTRHVFARGALRAAGWVGGRDAGLYSMRDVLFGNMDD